MSRLISDILDASEPHFSQSIKKWEHTTGNQSHDLRLLSDSARIRRKYLRALGLDDNDTTSEELYYALRHRAAELNSELEKYLDVNAETSPAELVGKIKDFVEKCYSEQEVWAIRSTKLKQLLKKCIPVRFLKALGLRSIDSVLKNSDSCFLLPLLMLCEKNDTHSKLFQQYERLAPSDFQLKPISIHILDQHKAARLEKAGYSLTSLVSPNFESGAILTITPRRRFRLDTLGLTMSLLRLMHEMRVYSSFLKHVSVKDNFGTLVSQSAQHGLGSSFAEDDIGWKALHLHFNRTPAAFERYEQPFMSFQDIKALEPVAALSRHLPSSEMWAEGWYGFAYDKQAIVSLHILDVLEDASNERKYLNRTKKHLKEYIMRDLAQRYLLHPPSVETIMRKHL